MNKTDKSQNIAEPGVSSGSVAIVGAGLIGRGWAIVFARAGWQVKLYDLDVGTLDVAKKKSLKQISIIVLVAFIIISFIFVKTMKIH